MGGGESDKETRAQAHSFLYQIYHRPRFINPKFQMGRIMNSIYSYREELQKQQAKERYDKLHMEGKTDEARADLARLALIRKQREDAAKKREEERKG